MKSITAWLEAFLQNTGDYGLFAWRAIRQGFWRPFEFDEIVRQLYEVGWRSIPLIAVSGFAFGVVLALETYSSMLAFGATSMIPQAVSFGMFQVMGPLLTALLLAGRVGAAIGAELAGMRVTEQVDALESLAVDSFKYLCVTRIVACVIALPVLTLICDFSGLAGGMSAELRATHMSVRLYLNDAFGPMGFPQYIPPTLKTIVFGFVIGSISCFLGYNATGGATGVGRASTKSVVMSSLLVILAEVILVKLIQFWWP